MRRLRCGSKGLVCACRGNAPAEQGRPLRLLTSSSERNAGWRCAGVVLQEDFLDMEAPGGANLNDADTWYVNS